MSVKKIFSILLIINLGIIGVTKAQHINLDLNTAINIAMKRSYSMRILEMGIKGSTLQLEAQKAALKTQVYMNITTPDIENISQSEWNSDSGRDEIVRQNTQLWQSELSVKQPLIFFGYPTNGFVSLNYKLYQFSQSSDGSSSQTDFYNRLYLQFEQPFFLPNEMKNKLEEAQLQLRDKKLAFLSDQMSIVKDIAGDYYDLFERSYKENVYQEQIKYLQGLSEIASAAAISDSNYTMDVKQIKLEINNAKEDLLNIESELRQKIANIKQKLRINIDDTVIVKPVIKLDSLDIDIKHAVFLGLQNNPDLQRLTVDKNRSIIDKENQEGQNAFHMTLNATYGLEKTNGAFQNLWEQFANSNSITLNAYIPIWDGGERRYRVQSAEMQILQNELELVEKQGDIKKDIRNSYLSMREYYERSKNMQKSIDLSEQIVRNKIKQYTEGTVKLDNAIQSIEQVVKTKLNFLDVYQDYRKSLVDLTVETYYNFEHKKSLIDEFEKKYSNN